MAPTYGKLAVLVLVGERDLADQTARSGKGRTSRPSRSMGSKPSAASVSEITPRMRRTQVVVFAVVDVAGGLADLEAMLAATSVKPVKRRAPEDDVVLRASAGAARLSTHDGDLGGVCRGRDGRAVRVRRRAERHDGRGACDLRERQRGSRGAGSRCSMRRCRRLSTRRASDASRSAHTPERTGASGGVNCVGSAGSRYEGVGRVTSARRECARAWAAGRAGLTVQARAWGSPGPAWRSAWSRGGERGGGEH